MNEVNYNENKPNSVQIKKILLIGHTDGYGGAQTAFRELFNFIQQEGHVVKVIVLSDHRLKNQPFDKSVLMGRIAYKESFVALRAKKILDLIKVGILAWRFQPDIFVSVGLNNSANMVARFLGKHCFKIGQDFIAERSVNDPLWISSRATLDGVGLQAPSMLDYWRTISVETPGINWIPCFPEPPVSGVLHSGHRNQDGQVRLAYFGRLAGNKGLPLLFQSLAVCSPNPSKKVTLDLWGQGEEETHLRQLATELDIANKVQFLGKYPKDEAGAKLMASYDALVLCSTEMEGLPLILLEAMAYGLPFLATNVGAIRDCCIDNPDAILVQPTQADITRGIQVLIQRIETSTFNPGRLQDFYEKTFSHQVMAARWRNCFQNPTRFFYESY